MAWTHVAFVESETEKGTRYEVKRAGNGRLGCPCESYRYAPAGAKTCKHIRSIDLAAAAEARIAAAGAGAVRDVHVQQVEVDGERFHVTRNRGIAFGGLAAALAQPVPRVVARTPAQVRERIVSTLKEQPDGRVMIDRQVLLRTLEILAGRL